MGTPTNLYIDAAVQDLCHARRICDRLPQVPTEILADLQWLQPPESFAAGKERWLLTKAPRHWLKVMPTLGDGVIRLAADTVLNTPYDTSFAVARVARGKGVVGHGVIQIHVDIETIIAELARRFARTPHQQFRVRVGIAGDPLAIDDITLFSHTLIPFFALMPNATLELRTRTDNISHLLQLAHQGRTVLSFALNPRALITGEERGTASLLERLIAARRCLNAGYRVAFAIDPIIRCQGWERFYEELLDELFTHIPPDACDGIDLTCLHYPRGLPELALQAFPGSHIFFEELVPVNGEYRYFRPIRDEMYQWFSTALARRQVPKQLCLSA